MRRITSLLTVLVIATAAGLAAAAPKVAELTDTATPTGWNAVENADPIEFGSC